MGKIADFFFQANLDDKRLQLDAKKSGDKAGTTMGTSIAASIKKSWSGEQLGKGLVQGLGLAGGLGAARVLETGLSLVKDQIVASIDAASNLRESMSLSAQVFEDNADQMSAWGDTTSKVFGQSKREALQYAANFGTAFKNVGMSLDETTDKAQTMTRLAADLGSAFNASSDEAATALRSGLLGESEPLRRFGVFLDEAKVKAKAAAMGMKPLNGALTDGQKVAARYAIIMEQTADSQGMFGRDTDSLADAQKSLTAAMEDAQAEIGKALLPMLKDLTVWTRDEAIPAFKVLLGTLGDVAKAADDLSRILDELAGRDEEAAESADLLGSKTTPLGKAIHGLADGITWLVNQELDLLDNGHRVADQMARELPEGMDKAGSAMTGFTGAADEAALGIGGSFKKISDASEKAQVKIGRSLKDIVSDFKYARDLLTGTASSAADAIWDPIIAKGELAATERELSEQRQILSSKESTKEQVADATLRINELNKTRFEQLAILASYGDTSAAITIANQIRVLEQTKKLSKEQRAQLALLKGALTGIKAAWTDVYTAANKASSVNPFKWQQQYGGGARASGGPVTAGRPYVVGEHRPELFVPETNGRIIPRVPAAGMASAPNRPNVTVNVEGLVKAPDPLAIARQLQRFADMGYLDGRDEEIA